MVRFGIAVLFVLATIHLHGQEWDTWQVSAFGVYGIPYGERCIEIRPVNPMNFDPTVQGLCRVGSFGLGASIRRQYTLTNNISLLGGFDYVVRPTNLDRKVSLGLGDDEVNYSRSKNMRIEVPLYALFVKERFSIGVGAKWLLWHQRKIYRHTNNMGKYLFFKNDGRLITEDFVATLRTAYRFQLREAPVSFYMELDFRDPAFRPAIRSWIDLIAGVSYHF